MEDCRLGDDPGRALDDAFEDRARRAVDGDDVALAQAPAGDDQLPIANLHGGRSNDRRDPPPPGHDRGVAGEPTAGRQDPDSFRHAVDVVR